MITKKLEPGNLVPCDIQVLDGMFKGCEAEIMWARGERNVPPHLDGRPHGPDVRGGAGAL